jgi:hypothetical protein
LNIVDILAHGWLGFPYYYYFIDMELCQFDLDTYIYGPKSAVLEEEDMVVLHSGLVAEDDFWLLGIENIWTIIEQIAEGVKYLHRCKQVHRDLKPKNSTSEVPFSLSLVSSLLPGVAYLENYRLWHQCCGHFQTGRGDQSVQRYG